MRIIKTITVLLFVIILVLFAGSGIYTWLVTDTISPTIVCDSDTVTVSVYDDESALLDGVSASDNRDGDLTQDIIVGSVSKLISDNLAKVTYYVFDSSDNMASVDRYVRYSDYEKPEINVEGTLIYAEGEAISLTGRVTASDCIDGDLSDEIHVSATDITADSAGTYHITAYVTNSLGDTAEMTIPLIITPEGLSRGQIQLSQYLVHLNTGDSFDPNAYPVSAVSASGRAVSLGTVSAESSVDTETPGVYTVLYSSVLANGSTIYGLLIVAVEG